MRLSPTVRTIFAVSVGILGTAVIGGFTFVAGVLVRMLARFIRPMRRVQMWLELMPMRWARSLERVIYQRIMGMSLAIDGLEAVRNAREDAITIVIANHPSTTTLVRFAAFVTQWIAPRPVFVAKFGHLVHPLYAPVFGWAIWAIRAAIFVRRWQWMRRFSKRFLPARWASRAETWMREDTRRSIRNGIRNIVTPGSCVILFPDQHRPTTKRLAADRKRFGVCYPGTNTPIKYALVPRSGGLLEILNAIDGHVRVIDITNALSVADDGVAKTGSKHVGAIYTINVDVITEPIPREPKKLQAWLNNRWSRKHWIIDQARKPARQNLALLFRRSRRA